MEKCANFWWRHLCKLQLYGLAWDRDVFGLNSMSSFEHISACLWTNLSIFLNQLVKKVFETTVYTHLSRVQISVLKVCVRVGRSSWILILTFDFDFWFCFFFFFQVSCGRYSSADNCHQLGDGICQWDVGCDLTGSSVSDRCQRAMGQESEDKLCEVSSPTLDDPVASL